MHLVFVGVTVVVVFGASEIFHRFVTGEELLVVLMVAMVATITYLVTCK